MPRSAARWPTSTASREAYSVTGEWDFVRIVRVPRHELLADVITGQHRQAARA